MAATWGPTNVAQHRAWKLRGHDLRVVVRGVDVTDRCRFFDDTSTPPVAELYRLTADGKKHFDEDRRPAVEVEHDFEIRERAPSSTFTCRFDCPHYRHAWPGCCQLHEGAS